MLPMFRFEPAARRPAPDRTIATFFTIVAAFGLIPAAAGLTYAGAAMSSGPNLFGVAFVAFLGVGLAQGVFYLRTALGRRVRNPHRWWLSTYLYNVALGIGCVGLMLSEFHPAQVAAIAWFATLSALALVAYSQSPRRK